MPRPLLLLLAALLAGCGPALGVVPRFVLGWAVVAPAQVALTGRASLDGAPWVGAAITAKRVADGAEVGSSLTDAAGRFFLALAVPAGTPLRLEARQGASRLAAFAVAPGIERAYRIAPPGRTLQQLPNDVVIDAATTLAVLTLAPRLEAVSRLVAANGGSTASAALAPLVRAYGEATAAAGLTLAALASDPALQATVVTALAAADSAAGAAALPPEVLAAVTAPGTPFAQALAQVARSFDEALVAAAGSGPVDLPASLLAPVVVGQATLPAASLVPAPIATASPGGSASDEPTAPPAAGGGGAGGGGSGGGGAFPAGGGLALGVGAGMPVRAATETGTPGWALAPGVPAAASAEGRALAPTVVAGVPTQAPGAASEFGLAVPEAAPAPAPAGGPSAALGVVVGVPAPAATASPSPVQLGR